MRTLLLPLAALAAFVSPLTASAQETGAAPEIRSGQLVVSSDGKRIGRIDRIVKDKAGAPVAATVIYASRLVRLPYSTLSVDAEQRTVTTLSRAEVSKLR